jgi:uncharacterized protein YgiM (DUF1202 family)
VRWPQRSHRCYGSTAPTWDDETTVRITITRFEKLSSLETLLIPLGGSLRQHPIYWDLPAATVQVDILNVRSGLGTDLEKCGELALNNEVNVLGKDSPACEWYCVSTSEGEGWIAAISEFSTLDRDCSALKVVTEETVQQFSLE